MFIEEGEVAYTYINGKKVPVVKCETEVILRNKENIAELASVIVIVIESPLPESSDTTIFFKIALDPAGVV